MKKKRKVPIFAVRLKGETTYEIFSQHPQVKQIVIEELIFAVKDGINKNKKSIDLFELDNSQMVVELERCNWKESLSTALDFYSSKEDYEKCAEIRDLIHKL